MMTLPLPSTSVHRSLGSKAAFAVRDLRIKMEPDSSSSCNLKSPSFSGSASFFDFWPKSNSCHVNLLAFFRGACSVEAYRRAPPLAASPRHLMAAAAAAAAVRCFLSDLGRRVPLRSRNAARTAGSRLAVGGPDGLGNDLGLPQAQPWRTGSGAVHSAEASPSDWARRNLRSLCDGAANFNAGGIADAKGLVNPVLDRESSQPELDQRKSNRRKLQNYCPPRLSMCTPPRSTQVTVYSDMVACI